MEDLCPNCLRRPIDPASRDGFCARCTAERHADKLAGERRWWRVNGRATRGYIDLATAPLAQLESVIKGGLASFVDVGLALQGIRDRRLYKDSGFASFEAYTLARWGFGRRHANYQIRAADFVVRLTASELGTAVPSSRAMLVHERHVRELMRLEDDEARECWAEIIAFYRPEDISLEVVTAEVDRRLLALDAPPELPVAVRLERLRRRADGLVVELEATDLPWDEVVGDVMRRLADAVIRYLSVAP